MKWIILVSSLLNLFLGILVWTRNPKNNINKYFGIYSIVASLWVFDNFVFRLFPNNLFYLRNSYALGAIVPVISIFWIYSIRQQKVNLIKKIIFLSLGMFFFILPHIDGFVIKDVINLTLAGYQGVIGPFFWIHSLYMIFILGFVFYNIYLGFTRSAGLRKIQFKFILIGSILWIIIIIYVSFILPLVGNINWTSFDSPSSLIFIAFTTFAIVRYRFMDIRAIIFRTIGFGFVLLLITSVFSVISTLITKVFTDLAGLQSNVYSGLIIALLVTLFYQPTRRVIERATNAFLYKKSYDPDVLMEKITEAASLILNFEKLLDKICAILTDAFHCEKIGVALLNDKKNKLKIAYQTGFKPGIAEKLVSFPNVAKVMFRQFRETPGIFVIDERKTQFDNGEFKPISPELLLALFENDLALIVPLYVKDKLIGALVIGTKKSGDPYASRDINILNIISGQFAVAIDRAQLYRHLEDLVEARTKELNEANIQLKKLDASKSDFISIASHQLRTPLTAIKGWISMINDGDLGKLPGKFNRPMKVVYASNERLIRLVNDLLNISRIESGRQKYDFKNNDLLALADEVVTKLQIQAEVKNLKLIFNKPKEKIPEVFCDGERIHEVMMNLVENAIKYTPSGSISVSMEAAPANVYMFKQPNNNSKENDTRPKDMLTFTVKDTGMGIAKEVMPLLFKKFARGEGSFVVHTEGTGLGLYVAKLNVEIHGGKVWAESDGVGKGSTFSFTIPIAGPKVLPFEASDAKK